MSPLNWIEEDLQEIANCYPDTTRLQLVGADPFCMDFKHLATICDLVHQYLPKVLTMTMGARVTNVKNKTVEELRILREKGITEINLGVESGDDWTLDRINKGYHSADIIEQCQKLDLAGINYWMTFLNGVTGKSHSLEHAINSAKIFSQCNPTVVGTGGLTLFEGTELCSEAENGIFDPLDEKELMIELKTFIKNLTCEPKKFITHHTSSLNLTGPFLSRKHEMIEAIQYGIDHFDMKKLSERRNKKEYL